MRIERDAAEGFREKLSAALLLAALFLVRGADAQQAGAPASDLPQAGSANHGLPEIYRRLFSGEEAQSGRTRIHVVFPIEPAELARLRYAGKSFRDWQELYLTDLEPASRLQALPALKKFGHYGYASEAVETIAAAFADDSDLVTQATDAAASIGVEAVPKLVELCKAARGLRRQSCAQALGKMGPNAAAAAPFLFDLLSTIDGKHEDDWLEQHYLSSALKEIGYVQAPTLLERLGSPDRNTRVLAAYLTGRLGPGQPGPATRQLTIGLRKAFKDDDPAARAVAGAALWQWAPTDEKTMLALRDAIENDERRVAGAIAEAIASTFQDQRTRESSPYGMPASSAVSMPVYSAVGAVSEGALANGVSLLGAAIRTPAFSQIFSDTQTGREQEYEQPRWEFPGIAKSSAGDTDAWFALEVYHGLNSAQGLAKPLVPELIKLAETDRENVVLAIANILGQIGPEAAPALPMLKKIVERRQKQGATPNDDTLLRVALDTIIRLQPPEMGLPPPALAAPAP